MYLGTTIDHEQDGQPSDDSSGDSSDEDGVVAVSPILAISDSSTTSSFRVIASTDGKLDAWIDFNGDGDWSDDQEQIAESVDLKHGVNFLSVEVPAGVGATGTAARFRLSEAGGLSPSGRAESGEVEDYWITILRDALRPEFVVELGQAAAFVSVQANRLLLVHQSQTLLDIPSSSQSNLVINAASSGEIQFIDPTAWRMGPASVVEGQFRRRATHVLCDAISIGIQAPTAWQNAVQASDVDNNGEVSPIDALVIINEIARKSYSDEFSGELMRPSDVDQWPGQYYDQNGDGNATPLDALRVINELARRQSAAVSTGYANLRQPGQNSGDTRVLSHYSLEGEFLSEGKKTPLPLLDDNLGDNQSLPQFFVAVTATSLDQQPQIEVTSLAGGLLDSESFFRLIRLEI